MKRSVVILVVGIALAIAGFYVIHFIRGSQERAILRDESPELAWLQNEFKLSDADYQKVRELHEAYLPQCAEMCKRVMEKNAEIKKLISQTNTVTPEIEAKLQEASLIRAECHKNMLKHFFAVSQSMPKAQGKRYLAWVQEQTLLDSTGMMGQAHHSQSSSHAHHD